MWVASCSPYFPRQVAEVTCVCVTLCVCRPLRPIGRGALLAWFGWVGALDAILACGGVFRNFRNIDKIGSSCGSRNPPTIIYFHNFHNFHKDM